MAESTARVRWSAMLVGFMTVVPCLSGGGLRAQAAQNRVTEPERPRFEVASVKPHRTDDDVLFAHWYDDSRFTATGSLRMLIRLAYGLQDSQLAGGPDWTDSDLYDIVATADGSATQGVMRLMLRELLADRFALRLGTEMRERPIYALSRAKSDSSLGPQLKRTAIHCNALLGAGRRSVLPSTPAGERAPCGIRLSPGNLVAGGMTMPALADHLSMWVDRIVTDRTGLQGQFDLSLKWLPDRVPETASSSSSASDVAPSAFDPSAPSIYTAVQEELGLRLEALRGLAEVFVVERADRPTAD
jgi:uncharacterized protein (TIGR03435 family)